MPLAFSLLFHASVLALLLPKDSARKAMHEQEIPVEVIIEPPPEQKLEPPAPRKEPPKEKVTLDEKPAFDAPRAANKERIEREAPDRETKAARMAPTEQTSPKPASQSAPQRLAEEKSDAETLEEAAPAPQTKLEGKPAQAEAKAPPAPLKQQSIADQIAALTPLPDYQLGSAAKPAPVAGGTAKTTYLSILFGLIMRQMHIPPGVRAKPIAGHGIVAFYVDELGNLTHQAVFRSSGQPELDATALAAVRRAAPFPAPPRGYPHAIHFHYSNR